jgi:hypothetical protein
VNWRKPAALLMTGISKVFRRTVSDIRSCRGLKTVRRQFEIGMVSSVPEPSATVLVTLGLLAVLMVKLLSGLSRSGRGRSKWMIWIANTRGL